MATSIVKKSTKNEKACKLIHSVAVTGDKGALRKILKDPQITVEEVDRFGRTPLMLTVLADQIECAEILLKNGANVDAKDKRGRTALHWAAYKGLSHFCALLISRGAYWREKDQESVTALHLATKHQNARCLALVMKELFVGEEDEQDVNKRTALHWSASYGNIEAVRMLIKQGSNIGIPDTDGKTPLHWAAMSGESPGAIATVQLILDTEPSVINWQDYEGRTALHLAVADGNMKTVEFLVHFQTLMEKCNVSVLDNMFRTPLHWAANLGHTGIVNLLLDEEASYSSSDSNGATALHYAAQNNHVDTVKAFLSCEGMTDEPDLERRTALMWAAGRGADDIIRVMMSHRADINATDKTGSTALHAAAMAGHASTINTLLELGADVNVTDENKHSPLFRAAEMGQTDAMISLIKGGGSVDVVDDEGRSPLHWASRGGHSLVCSDLLKNGISPNVQDLHARTPLQCAAYGGFIDCMNVLLTGGADPDLQDQEGVTALHYACSTGYLDAVRLLLDHRSFINHMELNEDCFTPLDHALLNGHHDVAQFMMEKGALSINTIRDLAASRIQANFRGYSVRRTFLERKQLLVKHEELRKNAAERKKSTNSSPNKTNVDCISMEDDTTGEADKAREDLAGKACGLVVTADDRIDVNGGQEKGQQMQLGGRLGRENREKTYTITPARGGKKAGSRETGADGTPRDGERGKTSGVSRKNGPETEGSQRNTPQPWGDKDKNANREEESNSADLKKRGEETGNDVLGEADSRGIDSGRNLGEVAEDTVTKKDQTIGVKVGDRGEKETNDEVDRRENSDRMSEDVMNGENQSKTEKRLDRAEVICIDECTQTSVNEEGSDGKRATGENQGMAGDAGIGRNEESRSSSGGRSRKISGKKEGKETGGKPPGGADDKSDGTNQLGRKNSEAAGEIYCEKIPTDEEGQDKRKPENCEVVRKSQLEEISDNMNRMDGSMMNHSSKEGGANQGRKCDHDDEEKRETERAGNTERHDKNASRREKRKTSSKRKPHQEKANLQEVEQAYLQQSFGKEVMLRREGRRGHSGGKRHVKKSERGRSSGHANEEEEFKDGVDGSSGKGALLEWIVNGDRGNYQATEDNKLRVVDRDAKKLGPISSYGKSLSFERREVPDTSKTKEKREHRYADHKTYSKDKPMTGIVGKTEQELGGGNDVERMKENYDGLGDDIVKARHKKQKSSESDGIPPTGKTVSRRGGEGGVVLQRRGIHSATKTSETRNVLDWSERDNTEADPKRERSMSDTKKVNDMTGLSDGSARRGTGKNRKDPLLDKEDVKGGVVLSKVPHTPLEKRATQPRIVKKKHIGKDSETERSSPSEVYMQRSRVENGTFGAGDRKTHLKGAGRRHERGKSSGKEDMMKGVRPKEDEFPKIGDDKDTQQEVELKQSETMVFPGGSQSSWSSSHRSVFDWRQPPDGKKTTRRGKQTEQDSKKATHPPGGQKTGRHTAGSSTLDSKKATHPPGGQKPGRHTAGSSTLGLRGAMITLEKSPRGPNLQHHKSIGAGKLRNNKSD